MADEPTAVLRALADRLDRVSAGHAERFGIRRDEDWYLLKLQEEVGELTQAWLKSTMRGRRVVDDEESIRQGLADEAADVLCQLLLFARRHDIDLMTGIRRKWLLFDRG